MKSHIAIAFMLFSLVAAAESNIKMSGSLEFGIDEFQENDGKPWYSMNGDVFGIGDWKQSTNDNWNDNREKFQATLNLNSEIKVSDKVKLNLGFETMVDELIGKTNGSGETAVQEFSTVRDNPAITLKDISAEIDTDLGKITLTNNFNYNFNNRVLATQLEDNYGEPVPYGEGILIEKNIKDFKTKVFLYEATENEVDPNSSEILVNGQNDITNDTNADKMVYGIDVKKEFSMGKIGALVINDHDKSSEVQGDSLDKDLDNLYIAVNGEFAPTDFIRVKGEYINVSYGKDVTSILNSFGQASWDDSAYDISATGAKDDSGIYEGSVILSPTANLEITAGYKDVGEDYIAVLGNSQRMDSWLGNASFDYADGTGYEKGLNGKVVYTLPFDLLTKTSLEYTNYDLTRTALNEAEDDKEEELTGKIGITEDKWKAEISGRVKTLTNDNTQLDYLYNDYNINGELTVLDRSKVNTKISGSINYYTGDDRIEEQNFSTEKRVIVGTTTNYIITEKLNLTGSYSFGYVTEDNDVIKDGNATQNLFKLGLSYKMSNDVAFNLMYKYDNYDYDVKATAAELTNSVYKKEVEHQWYDGLESWDHSGSEWTSWKNTIPESYTGYETHEIKASVIVRF